MARLCRKAEVGGQLAGPPRFGKRPVRGGSRSKKSGAPDPAYSQKIPATSRFPPEQPDDDGAEELAR